MAKPGGYWDGFVNGDDLFHNVINMLDFPLESVEGDNSVDVEDWQAQFQRLGPIPSELFQGIAPVSQANIVNNFVPSDATSELKQQADLTEISSTSKPPDSSTTKESSFFQTRSLISVLESSSSCSAEKSMSTCPDLILIRTQTKIPRRSTFSKWHLISPITPSKKILNRKGQKKKKRKLTQLSGDTQIKENSSHQHIRSKRCTHCQVEKTPQWREGPMGPKTLCNACGVRYRSGRLLPEYRPAASPTFVPSLHSNSHTKVMQMRNQSIQECKRCTHCQVKKTPQWREGPMGPKTLCNACGVRNRSGRLLPEYRPAASPTFVPSLHSNSHTEVIQMRNQSIQESLMPEMDPAMSPPPEFVPTSTYLFDHI